MQVYGDYRRLVSSEAALARVQDRLRDLGGAERGLIWHGRCVALLVELGMLLQGAADAELAIAGCDELSPAQQALMKAMQRVAAAVRNSWQSGFTDQVAPDLADLSGIALADLVRLSRPEGFAFYAVYPEAFVQSAAAVPRGSIVIGLRSIGTSLAAVVSEAIGAEAVFTLRPGGDPFDRRVRAGRRLERLVSSNAHRHFVIVDEGPGLSGSSFGGVADWVEGLGVPRERIVFMPSHRGDPGPRAAPAHRERWRAARRPVATFDDVFFSKRPRTTLSEWFIDITGEPKSLVDLSGGAWAATMPEVPTHPGWEARKFALRAERGRYRLKYSGIGSEAAGKLARAEALSQAGFGVQPLAMRHGFLLERELDATIASSVPLRRIAEYLSFRAEHFPAEDQGASLERLVAAATANLLEAGVQGGVEAAARQFDERAAELKALCRPVHVDGRLHRCEWLEVGDGIIKTDALDHSGAHDLVGCQDIAWDVAGAAIEFELDHGAPAELARAVLGSQPGKGELLRLMTFCYLGFQVGWWSFSSSGAGQERSRWYARRAEALLAGQD